MTRMRIPAAAAGVILTAAVLLSGCGASGDSSSRGESTAGDNAAAAPRQADGSGESKTGVGTDGKAAPNAPQPTVARAIIKTGSLSVEADDVGLLRQKAIGVVTGLQGQVASEDSGGFDGGRITQATLVLKVPSASYQTAIDRISALATRTAIHQESNDVTEQVVDVESRIATQRASLERMRGLLAKATTIGEIVSVETELTRREADLESLLAKQKNLSLQTELATLSLTVSQKGKAPEPKDDDRGFVAGLKGGWDAFTATFSAVATAVGAMLPFLILIALIVIPLWRYRARLRRPAQPTQPQPATGEASS
jgi:hypothetical protein